MQYAGIFVRCRRESTEAAVGGIAALPGVEVHHHDAGTGRLVAVLESHEPKELAAVLPRIRGVTGVLVAEPVYRFDDDDGCSDDDEGGQGPRRGDSQ